MSKPNKPEQESPVSRRDLFHIIGSAPVAAALAVPAAAQAHEHALSAGLGAPAAGGPYKRQTFDDHQWETVRILCDLIIPADDRSGSATQAEVPEFLDDWIAFRTEQDGNENLKAQIFGGLMWLDRESLRSSGKKFAESTDDVKKTLLDRIAYPARAAKEDKPFVKFFSEFRSLTVGGFFSSKIGVADLPYLGNTAVSEWKGCDPKVWAVIEERLKTGYKGVLEAKPWSSPA